MSEVSRLLKENLPLINEALTSPHTQLVDNYERLEIYGDALISFLVIVELYLTREKRFNENDLDNLRKQRISNDNFVFINYQQDIYKFMMTEPLQQSATTTAGGSTDLAKSAATKPKESSALSNIIRAVTPGGLDDPYFQEKLRRQRYQNFQAKKFQIKVEM